MSEFSKQYREKLLPGQKHAFADTDPEFVQIFESFAFDEVVNQGDLDERTRFMAILAALLGCQGVDEFKVMLPAALNMGVTPVEVKEIVYQSGVSLPLEGQATTTPKTRLEAGNQVQVDIFGEAMRGFQNSGPQESRHINKWLADNCFGDYYTRKGLDDKQREMITFCFLAAQGGCEPQLTSHATANIRIGNDKDFLIQVLSQCLPYIGYPRSLNALRCVNEAAMG